MMIAKRIAPPSQFRHWTWRYAVDQTLDPSEIRARRAEAPKLRDRDIAENLGVSEAQLVAAHCGHGATRIAAHPDRIMPLVEHLGEVMALTRNTSCVHETIGAYSNYHPGEHAAMVLAEQIDLRMFPSHWRHAFCVEHEVEDGVRRSIQVFDAAGDAVHKIFLRDRSTEKAWDRVRAALTLEDQSEWQSVEQRLPVERPKTAPDKVEILRKEWSRMTDTHQFLRLVSKLKMNRLGAYRVAERRYARQLGTDAVDALLHRLRDSGTEVMVFVGNRGCIQIHSGPIKTLRTMGPWQNVMDPDFNLHLRLDHIAEVWDIDKPTQRGMVTSLEAFDAEGAMILQIFGVPKEGKDSREAFRAIVRDLEGVAA